MKSKNFVSLILCVLLLVTVFGACGKKDESEVTSSGNGLSTADVNFISSDGSSTYIVVRPADCDSELAETVSGLYRSIKGILGVNPKNKSDDENGDGIPEILIGDTNRNASKVAKEVLLSEGTGRADEYIICTVDEDIAIVGITVRSTMAAVDYFTENILPQKTVAGGLNHLNSDPDKYGSIELFGSGNLYGIEIVRPIYNVSYITQQETDKLIGKVFEITGYELNLVNDQKVTDSELVPTEAAEYEIIIGNCARDGVSSISDSNQYEIRIEDKKIYLNGGSPYATALAVTEFTKLISADGDITSADSVSGGNYENTVAAYDSSEYYYPTWKEDFNVADINDLAMWNVRWDEKSGYTEEGKPSYRGSSSLVNNYIQDGKVYMDAVDNPNGYYGGLIDTRGLFEFQYGFIEISDLHPKGEGFWSAFWTVSSGNTTATGLPNPNMDYIYYSETDIDECYGAGTWAYGNTFAWPTGHGKDMGKQTIHVNNVVHAEDSRGFFMDFHTYGFEWVDSTKVRFTCDGKVFAEQDLREGEQNAYIQPQYLKLSLAVGTGEHEMNATADEWSKTNRFITDYIYLYQKRGQKTFYGAGGDYNTDWRMQERY